VIVAGTDQRRQHFRVELNPPLCSDMTIVMIKGKSLEVGSAEVLIVDIGPGGLRFKTCLRLPVHPDVVLQFETEVLSQRIQMYGNIVRSAEQEEGIFAYGVKFTMDEEKHAELARVLNRLAIRQKKVETVPSGRFLVGDPHAYLRSTAHPSEKTSS
jgi:hypothetical protein